MCFAVPWKVVIIDNGWATLENGDKARLDPELKVSIGSYVRVRGNIVVDYLTKEEGEEIQKVIKTYA